MISKTQLKNKIYKETQKLTACLYHDEYWQGVHLVKMAINDIIDENGGGYYLSLFVNNGGYHTSKDGMSRWKEYRINIYSDNSDIPVIQGTLNCHAAGTIEDPFKSYDMSLCI